MVRLSYLRSLRLGLLGLISFSPLFDFAIGDLALLGLLEILMILMLLMLLQAIEISVVLPIKRMLRAGNVKFMLVLVHC